MKNLLTTVLLVFSFSLIGTEVWSQTTFIVTNNNPTGSGSLADAIALANRDAYQDTIRFDPQAFNVSQAIIFPSGYGDLPITNPVVIIGPNKPGQSPWLMLKSQETHEVSTALRINADNVHISNLSFLNFKKGIEIEQGHSYITIRDCHLAGNKDVQIEARSVSDLFISNTFFGTTPEGDYPYDLAEQGDGLHLSYAVNAGNTIEHCLFGGLDGDALTLKYCKFVTVKNNIFGTNLSETGRLINTGSGIRLEEFSTENEIIGNVVVNSLRNGVVIEDSYNNYLHDNYIGTTTGKEMLPNQRSGVYISGISYNNVIGDQESGMNYIRFNGEYGVKIDSISAYGNRLIDNDLSCNQFGGIGLENQANGSFIAPVIERVSQRSGITGVSPTKQGVIMVYATNPDCKDDCSGAFPLFSERISPSPGSGVFEIAWNALWTGYFVDNPTARLTVLVYDPATGNTSPFSNCVSPCLLKHPTEIAPQHFCNPGETFDAKFYFEEVNNKGGVPTIKYQWTFANRVVSTTSVLTINRPGKYLLEVSACNDSSVYRLEVEFLTYDYFVDAGEDRIINAGESYQIQARVSETNWKSCSWRPTLGLVGPTNVLNPVAKPNETTTYTITVEFANGCTREDSITIAIEPTITARWGMNPAGSLLEYPASLQVLSNGTVAAMGTFEGSLEWGAESMTTPTKQEDVFLLLADENGNPRIGRKGGGMSIDRVIGSAKDSKDNIWMTGVFAGTLILGKDTLVSDAGDDIFIAKFDENGNPRIGRKGGGMSIDRVSGITLDKNDNIHVVGSLKGNFQMDNTFATTANGNESMFAVTLDQNLVAQQSITSQALDNQAVNRISHLTRDRDGNIIIVGETKGSFRIDQLHLPALPNSQSTDIFMAKLTPELKPVWAKKFVGKSTEKVSGLAVDSENNIYLGGTFRNQMSAGGRPLVSKGGQDFFLIKMGGNGRLMWNVAGGGADDDTLAALATDAKGALYIMGSVSNGASFMDRNFTAQGGRDLFLVKIAPKGVSVPEIESKPTLSFYPNPNNGSFQIRLPEGNSGKLKVTDLLGKTVRHTFTLETDGTATVRLEEYSVRGVYFLQYTSEQGTWTGKMIKE
jgi:parallel beta-helix repeat protein